MNIQSDILSLSIAPADGMPKAPYAVSNTVLNKVIQMEENESLQRSIKEYKAVIQALQLVNTEAKAIFEKEYRESRSRWEVINVLNISESTYERRKKQLIYTVNKEIKKMTEN